MIKVTLAARTKKFSLCSQTIFSNYSRFTVETRSLVKSNKVWLNQ